jgi:parallel beta-helix repeat protein
MSTNARLRRLAGLFALTPLLAILGGAAPSAAPAAARTGAPCIRVTRPGTQVQGEVKVCPGRYRVRDPQERGVLVVVGSGTRLDLSGVTLESGDTAAGGFVGVGVASRGVERVTVVGGTVRGYRYGVRLEGGRAHRVEGIDLSGSRAQRLHSTPARYDERDWLDIFRPDTFETYGAGLFVEDAVAPTITGVTAREAQNGIMLSGVREGYVAGNDVSGNSGWGIALWRSSRNTIVRNVASRNVRCESASYSRGCDSAALLLRQQSDSNTIVDNDLRYSGDGFFLSGHQPLVRQSVGNVVARNDATGAYHNAFESTFSWGNTFLDNRADSSNFGFWLGYSTANVVRGNTVLGSRTAAIAIEHGSDNELDANVIIGGRIGIRLFAPRADGPTSRGYRIDDNLLARVERALVLERTAQARIRGNVFDGVGEGLAIDSAGRNSIVHGNVFLRAQRTFIEAPSLDAGGNFWGTPSLEATRERVRGNVDLEPWRPASAAGY